MATQKDESAEQIDNSQLDNAQENQTDQDGLLETGLEELDLENLDLQVEAIDERISPSETNVFDK